MSSQGILATYTDGVFRPTIPTAIDLQEGQHVLLAVEPISRGIYLLTLARQVHVGLSEEEIAEIEQIIRHRQLSSKEETDKKAEEAQSNGQTVE